MSLSPDLALIERALNSLEPREVRVLVWGLVDSALSEAEVDDSLSRVLRDSGSIASDVRCTIDSIPTFRQRLIDLGHLVEVPARLGGVARYRTRMGEGVRLFARLRQLFPGRHGGRDGWIGGATLVADYRLLWRPRRYPRRDLTSADAVNRISQRVHNTQLIEMVQRWLDQAEPSWRLSQFQIDASARILEGLDVQSPRGTLVAAGTGSGKTLAFYLPALAWLASQKKARPRAKGPRILALYPRNELLKDQLAEVFEQARKFDDYLGRFGTTISVGVLYGDTPQSIRSSREKWKRTRGACPFFPCPECGGELRIQSDQVSESEARLICGSCGDHVEGQQLKFTRKAMQEDPPDILFTTVEMMNQRMSDSTMRHLFGLGPNAERVPTLMLLDEVHLYTGTYGAQVAHLLRRWSYQTRRRTQFVGLSATISEGRAFFSSLVNLDPSVVEEISPNHDDMVSEGAEYMLALRGDPVSQAALLSTSIQSLMLASRLLDRRQDVGTDRRPFSGWRAFAFTDQVDATNRLFYDLRDAEGRTPDGIPATFRYPNGGLAHLRAPGPSLRRYEGGQDWRVARQIGHDLSARHRVERTTAYDAGVSHDAEIVVATSALEVGYDDPAVGVVLQHKAPRDMAQFLQRKGRGGRTRHMRPWTIMVLSDYGRDRLAYQTYEQFFDPELPPRELPLSNRYIRRMQATYSLIDYLGVQMQTGEPGGSVWIDLSGPQETSFKNWDQNVIHRIKASIKDRAFPISTGDSAALTSLALRDAPRSSDDPNSKWNGLTWIRSQLRRRYLVRLLNQLLKEPTSSEDFAQHLAESLSLTREDVDTLLWDHPRPLLLGAIPTALRRLATDWRAHGQAQADRAGHHPLPEFVPATLFSDLTLPEVRLLRGQSSPQELPVLQALSEMAPGKVSRRLDDALWLGPDEAQLTTMLDGSSSPPSPVLDVDIEPWYTVEPQTPFHQIEDGQAALCDAYRPLDLNLAPPPSAMAGGRPKVLDTSNARLLWRSQLFGRRAGANLSAPQERVGIARLIREVVVHTHASQSEATARRYAIASRVNLRVRRNGTTGDFSATWRFLRSGRRCGVGFEIEVDALCFVLRLPASPSSDLRDADPTVQRAARTARFLWEAQHGDTLLAVTENPFLRAWLAQVFQVAVVALAVERRCSLSQASDLLSTPSESGRLQNVLHTIFQSPDAPDDDDGSHTTAPEPRLRASLNVALANPEAIKALQGLCTKTLTAAIDNEWDGWLRQTMMQTLGAALVDAIQQACPQVDPEELAVDTDAGPSEDGSVREHSQLWISEINPGGNGLIEQVVEALATDPDHFYRRVEAALGPSEFEQIDLQLREYVERIGGVAPDEDWTAATQAVRTAASSQDAADNLSALRHMLAARGHAVFHGYVAALSNRLLRPDTPTELDSLLAELLRDWDALEVRHGVEVEGRVMCALFSHDPRIDAAFASAGFDLPANHRETWRFSMLLGVLWARGHGLRSHSLPVSMRFADTPPVTERLLLSSWLSKTEDPIAGDCPEAVERLHARLIRYGRAVIKLPPDAELLNRLVSLIVTLPVQLEYLNVYPRLSSVVRGRGEIELHLELEATA